MDSQSNKNVSYKIIENSAIFTNPHAFFIFQKIEKISTALYLITSYYSEQEPLKWNIREIATRLMEDVMLVTKKGIDDQIKDLRDLNRSMMHVSSLLQLSEKIGLISSVNYSIISSEIRKATKQMEEVIKGQKDMDDKAVEEEINAKKDIDKGQDVKDKEMIEISPFEHKSPLTSNKPSSSSVPNKDPQNTQNKSAQNKTRIAKILQIIKESESGHVSIKDVTSKISGYSDKTVQRDLLKLVKEGTLLKEGERRWSTYSIKSL